MRFKKKTDRDTAVEREMERGMDHDVRMDVEEVMRKYDRESNTRIWEGVPKQIVRCFMAALSVYCLCVTLLDKGLPEVRLTMFLGLFLIAGYLNYPASKKHVRPNTMPWYDVLIMLAGSASFFYFAANAEKIINMGLNVKTTDIFMLTIAAVGILSLVELCRRSVGLPILCVVAVLLIYTLFFARVRFGMMMNDLFFTTNGVMGTPINTCQKYIVVFIIFGAFLERTGIANFFIDLANSVAGASAGGPAKVAVISSALCCMVSGSSVGNTVTTGSVTIPMMKKTGYRPEFAGAVEAAASTGGQIMPPIMGAAAFLMAEYTGIPYPRIALLAVLPALLYFTGIYIAVHLEAVKMGLKGIPREELPKMRELIKKIYLLAPLVVLVILVSNGTRSMAYSAALAILVTLGVGVVSNLFNSAHEHISFARTFVTESAAGDGITFNKFIDALEAGSKGTISVTAACAMAGIVANCVTITGLASKVLLAIVNASGGHAIIALLLTMICCIILGMGVPTTANYCIMASTCAPILIDPRIGIPMIAAHFFVFYFGIVADITPPVALAAYAGSAIAKAPPMKTALNATRLAIAAFIVPYIFALNPVMLLEFPEGISALMKTLEVVQIVASSLFGLFGVASGLAGHILRPMPWWERILCIAGGLAMMIPGTLTDVIGLAVVGVVILQQVLARKCAANAE